MYDVIDVCNHIINYSNEKDYGVSNLKLQKLLYFVQAYFLIKTSKKCFYNKIEAWGFGPVVPDAYWKFSRYGNCNIYTFKKLGKYERISKENREYINEIIEKFKDYSASDLTRISQSQDPWQNAYCPTRAREITALAIKKYFTE